MRRLWTEPEMTFQGRYFQVQSVRLGLRPLQQPGVPLWLAGSADNALRRVLRLGDGWLPISSSPQAFTADWERLQVLGQEIGRDARDLHRCLYTTLNVNAEAGRVILRGTAPTAAQIAAIAERVRAIVGVAEVENRLHLPAPPASAGPGA